MRKRLERLLAATILEFPFSRADFLASLKGAPEVLFFGTLCVFGYLNWSAVPRPERSRYESRGFNVRFGPAQESARDAVASHPGAVAARAAAQAKLLPRSALNADAALGFSSAETAAAHEAAARGLLASPPSAESGEEYSMAGVGMPSAPKSAFGAIAFMTGTARRASLVVDSEEKAAEAAPKIKEEHARDAGALPGFMRSLWPITVRTLLNNRTFTDSLYENPWTKKACEDPNFLRDYLKDGKDPQGVTRELGLVLQAAKDPALIRSLAGTKFAERVLECPSVEKLGRDEKAVQALAKDNPALLQIAKHPMAPEIFGSNPKAAEIYKDVLRALEPPLKPR